MPAGVPRCQHGALGRVQSVSHEAPGSTPRVVGTVLTGSRHPVPRQPPVPCLLLANLPPAVLGPLHWQSHWVPPTSAHSRPWWLGCSDTREPHTDSMVVLIRALLGLGHQVLQAMPPCPSFDCICSVNIPLVGRVEKRGRAMLPTSSTHKGHTVHPTPSWSIFFPAQIVQHEYEPSRLSTVALPDLPTPAPHHAPAFIT